MLHLPTRLSLTLVAVRHAPERGAPPHQESGARRGRAFIAVLLPVLAVSALFALPRAAGPARAAPANGDDWHIVGQWATLATADDVRAVARDGAGLWAASASGGVVRWAADGSTARQYLSPQHGLPCNDVRDVLRWRGVWWFATCDGLAFYNPTRDRMETVDADLPSRSMTALAVDERDRLWVGAGQWWNPALSLPGKATPGGWDGGGVAFTADGQVWTDLGTTGGLPSSNVRDLVAWRAAMWVATEPHQAWKPPSRDAEGNPIEGRWEANGGGVARRDGERWMVFSSDSNAELSDNARVLAADANGLWVGTGGRGLVAFNGAQWKALEDCGNEIRCIQDNFVTALAVGADGAIWVGTARFNGRGTGINVLDARGTPVDPSDDAWHVIGAGAGLPGTLIGAIHPDADGTVWLGTANMDPQGRVHGAGLAHLLGDRETLQTHSTATTGDGTPADNDITTLARHPVTGELWVGTARAGIGVRDAAGRWRKITTASSGGGLGSDDIADIAIEPTGVVWVATRQTIYDARSYAWVDGGLSRFDGQTWRHIDAAASGLPSDHLSALALDERGKLWVGTGATDRGPKEHAYRGWGLAVVDTQTQRWERTFTFPTLTSNNITDLVVKGNELWVGTSYFFYVDSRPGGAQLSIGGGVSVYNLDTGRWRKISAKEGLTVAVRGRGAGTGQELLDVRSIYVDDQGQAWVGSLSYPDGGYAPDVRPDGIVDIVGLTGVRQQRFVAAGPVGSLVADGDGHPWAATAWDGMRIWVGDHWLREGAAPGGLPSDAITDMCFDGGEVWLATGDRGVVRLMAAGGDGSIGTDPGELPGGVLKRLPRRVYMPIAHLQLPPRLVAEP
jgi:ligand-binding sensor domain-containing protein